MPIKYSKDFLSKDSFLKSEIKRLEKVKAKNFGHSKKIKEAKDLLKLQLRRFREGYIMAARERECQRNL